MEVRSDPFGGALDSFSGLAPLAAPVAMTGTAFNAGGGEGYQAASMRFGLQVEAVPEPETFALMLLGLGLTGVVAGRRNQRGQAGEPRRRRLGGHRD